MNPDRSVHGGSPGRFAGLPTDVGHHAIDEDVVCVAVVGDTGETTVPEKTVEASIERPVRIQVGGIVRVQELKSEGVNIGISL